jgi:Tfp pilus assembly protein PilN
MKLTTNFIRPAGWLAPYLAGMALLVSAVLLTFLVVLWVAAQQLQSEQPDLEAQLQRLRDRDVVAPVPPIAEETLITLRDQVQRLNNLTGSVGTSLPQLLPRLETWLPDAVWLLSLQHRAREGETRLLVASDRAELLTDFMERLEKSHSFTQVLLTRKVQRSDGAQHTVQFEILLREQP